MGVIDNNWCTQPWCQYAWCVPTGYEALHVQATLVTVSYTACHIQVRIVA